MACCLIFAFFATIALSFWARMTRFFSFAHAPKTDPLCWQLTFDNDGTDKKEAAHE